MNSYKDIPDCNYEGCNKAGVFFLIPTKYSYCDVHMKAIEAHKEMGKQRFFVSFEDDPRRD